MRRARPASRLILVAALAACACGSGESAAPAGAPAQPAPSSAVAPAAADLQQGLVLALAQFVEKDGKPVPGPARLEFLSFRGGKWQMTAIEDPDSNVFHKAMPYAAAAGTRLLTLGGSAAAVKLWEKTDKGLVGTPIWVKDFGGKFSRMRDAEVADLYGDDRNTIAVATHDQGVVELLRPNPDGSFDAVEIDHQKDTFVHEIEIGDLDGDGVLEVYATPSEPNRLDERPQSGRVVRYVPARGEGRKVVADLGKRHAKEILVGDVDGDGRDELYVSVEGEVGGEGGKQLISPVEIRRYDAGTPPDQGVVIATIDDRLSRFLVAGDLDGDGKRELIASTFSSGIWLLRPGKDPKARWRAELVDADSAGFEHATVIADLDGDGVSELYVASDKHKEVRRYVWKNGKPVREVIYRRGDDRPIFTWNLMPVPVELIP
jgi:FG-GAP-like repeat